MGTEPEPRQNIAAAAQNSDIQGIWKGTNIYLFLDLEEKKKNKYYFLGGS